jgi:hypothetical protein
VLISVVGVLGMLQYLTPSYQFVRRRGSGYVKTRVDNHFWALQLGFSALKARKTTFCLNPKPQNGLVYL